MRAVFLAMLGALLCCGLAIGDTQTQHVSTHQDGVLGTSLDISLWVMPGEVKQAEGAMSLAVSHIYALETALSRYRGDSELSRLNKHTELPQVSTDLLAVLNHCQYWQRQSQGVFSCGLGQLKTLWQEANANQVVPDRVALRQMARTIHRTDLFTQKQGVIKLGDGIKIDADGLAKGYIIDQVFTALKQALPSALAIKVDIGGDGRYWRATARQPEWKIGLVNTNNMADNQAGLGLVALTDMAIASSGHTSRFFDIEHRRFSHILSSKEGWPLFDAPAAFVIAKDATTADAVATALSTQTLSEGLDWVNTLDHVEALLVSPQGLQVASTGWGQFVRDKGSTRISPFALNINYTIPRVNSGEYNKPYVAIWLTDANSKPVRNLLLLGESERWARENTRWWRKVGRRNADLLDGLARPTRRPGAYNLVWDGMTDYGTYLTVGEYTLHIEAAREQGGHDYHKFDLSLKHTAFELSLTDLGAELGTLELGYAPSASAQN